MIEFRRADPAFRRRIIIVLLIGMFVGALLIVGFEQYRTQLREWILSEPGAVAQRANLILLVLAAFLLAPLLGLAVYLWSLGEKVLRTREFPPPGFRVIRDTPVITGESAVSRGRLLEALALACVVVSVSLGLLLWRLASSLSGHAA